MVTGAIAGNISTEATTPTGNTFVEATRGEREGCWKANATAIQTGWPPELFQLSSEGISGFKEIGVDLYNRKLTYGEANKRIEDLGNSIKARVIPIVKQYQAENHQGSATPPRRPTQRLIGRRGTVRASADIPGPAPRPHPGPPIP